MSDTAAVKRALGRLADGPPDDATVLANADRATSDLDAAAWFVDAGGVARLRAVVDRTGEGADRLAAFERYRAACQFHSGHVTDLSAGPKEGPD